MAPIHHAHPPKKIYILSPKLNLNRFRARNLSATIMDLDSEKEFELRGKVEILNQDVQLLSSKLDFCL